MSAKVVASGGIGARTCTKSIPDHFKAMQPGCFLFRKDKNQDSLPSLLEGSISSNYIFTHPQKWPKTRFWSF